MSQAAFLAALALIRNASPEELRLYQNQRDFELALNSIGITSQDLDAAEMQTLREEIEGRGGRG